jgi:glutamate synthase (NADPH/NADH) large chain
LSGGIIIVRPMVASALESKANTIIGNTVLYGATAGTLLAAGQAGERFAVRNSGATVVVEGCGANGCEYMTGGTAVILGKTGENFGAGMTGGMGFVLDEDDSFASRTNPESITLHRLGSVWWEARLKSLIALHATKTDSRWSNAILDDWDRWRGKFWQIVPREMLDRLEHPLVDVAEAELVAAE